MNIVEEFANEETLPMATIVVGFDGNKDAYRKSRVNAEEKDWTDWEPWGSSVDYESNAQFAELNGCTFKVDKSGS